MTYFASRAGCLTRERVRTGVQVHMYVYVYVHVRRYPSFLFSASRHSSHRGIISQRRPTSG